MAGGQGFEPQYMGPKPIVLPLDDPPLPFAHFELNQRLWLARSLLYQNFFSKTAYSTVTTRSSTKLLFGSITLSLYCPVRSFVISPDTS